MSQNMFVRLKTRNAFGDWAALEPAKAYITIAIRLGYDYDEKLT